jgi:hypothetical protein
MSTPLLGLALPLDGTTNWGTLVNTSITALIDSAVAGTTPITSSATPYTLDATAEAANEARQAVILCTGATSGVQTIIAPARSKTYVVINATTNGHAVKICGPGPTTGITVPNGKAYMVAWNGSDFVTTGVTSINLATDVSGTLPIANGGTGQTTQQAAINALVGTQTANRVLRSDGTNSTLAQVALATDVSGTLPVANGGTGQTTQQASINALAGAVTSGQFLRGNGTNVVMSAIQVADVPLLNQNTTGTAAGLSATLAVANGGTGQTSYTDGQLLIGNTTGNTLSKATLTAGSGISITNGSGAITIATTGAAGVTSVTATAPVVSSGGSTPVISLNTVPVSSGGTGLTSFTATGVLYANGTTTLATSLGLTFNSSTGNFGLGKSSPFYRLDVETTTNFTTPYIASFVNTSTNTSQANLLRFSQGVSDYQGLIGTFGATYSGSAWAGTFGVGSVNNIPLSLGTNNTVRVQIDTAGNAQMQTGAVMPYAPAPASISTTATLTNADIQAQIINTTGTSYTITMPLGTTLETIATWVWNNTAYDFTVINTASGTITVAANTGVTTLGALTIATGTSAQFRIRRTSANTFVLYRLS